MRKCLGGWGRTSDKIAQPKIAFQITREGTKVSVPLPNLLVCSFGHSGLCTYTHTRGQGSSPLQMWGCQPSRQAWEKSVLGATLVTNHTWDVKNLLVLHHAFQGTSDFTRNPPDCSTGHVKASKPLPRGLGLLLGCKKPQGKESRTEAGSSWFLQWCRAKSPFTVGPGI